MYLNDRKIQILEAIINDYIATGEPIGSRTITKKYNFGLSSATIRNEMSDLEDMGYITQPHASAGRAPTDKGYRLYVDKLMKFRELSKEEIDYLHEMVRSNIDQIDYLMEETAKAISVLTNYTTFATPIKKKKTKIKIVQLLPVDMDSIAFVLITSEKVVKNSIIRTANADDYVALVEITNVLNRKLIGKSALDIDKLLIAQIVEEVAPIGDYSKLVILVLSTIINVLMEEEQANIYLSGAKNILEFPEFSDIQKAKSMLQTFEEKELLITLLGDDLGEPFQIVIGDENSIKEMKNCSVIKSQLMADGKNYGSIGILGPTRMDYSQAASVLDAIVKSIEKTIRALSGG